MDDLDAIMQGLETPKPGKREPIDIWGRRRLVYAQRRVWLQGRAKRKARAPGSRMRTFLAMTILGLGAAIILWVVR